MTLSSFFAEFTETTIFHEIASQWDIKVAEFILINGGEIDGVDNEGRTPLHIAAYCNHTDMITFLLDNGGWKILLIYSINVSFGIAKLDAKSDDEQTVVHYAVRGSAIEALELLIDKGGNSLSLSLSLSLKHTWTKFLFP